MCAARALAVAYINLCLVDDTEFDEAMEGVPPLIVVYNV